MSDFAGIVLGFPTALFTFSLVVVVGYWITVVLGVAGIDMLDGEVELDADGADGLLGGMSWLRLGGVPVTVALSLLIAFCWFFSLVGAVILGSRDVPGPLGAALGLLVLVLALIAGWLATRLVVMPLRRALPELTESSRHDFVGRMCVIRTGRVGRDFGQAETTSPDGSSAIIQVRAEGTDSRPLTAGSTALIYEYDEAGEFFRVMPYDPVFDPDLPTS